MFDAQRTQRVQRLIPLLARFVRIDRVRRDQLARGIDHRDLDARAQAGVEPQHDLWPRRCGQHQVLEVGAEHIDRLGISLFARLRKQIEHQVQLKFCAPRETAGVKQPLVTGPPFRVDTGMQRDAALRLQVPGFGVGAGVQIQLHELLAPRPQQREQAMGWNPRQRFGMVEVVAVLRPFGLLAFDHACADHADLAHPLAQAADQRRVLAPALQQDRARTVEGSLCVSDAFGLVDIARRGISRHPRRIGEQRIG